MSAAGMSLALFERYPELADRLPRVPLVQTPTSVERLDRLAQHLGGGEIWVKRDDQSARPYGGNKPRKLEFLLGSAKARGARTLITFGGLGSNHALATTIYGREHGFALELVLVPQPIDHHVQNNMVALHALGAHLTYAASDLQAVAAAARGWLKAMARDRRRPYLIPPGGSSPVGALGYVNAGLELAQQVEAGLLPAPHAIFLASGSNGTAAGLLVGLRLGGLETELTAVRVSDRVSTDARSIVRLAQATARLLASCSPRLPRLSFRPADISAIQGYLGRGYGHPTSAGDRAVELLVETEQLPLERVYTGKAMAALLDTLDRPGWRSRPLLFWNTFNSRPIEPLVPPSASVAELPPPLRELIAG